MFFAALMGFFVLFLSGLEMIITGQYMIGSTSLGVIASSPLVLKASNKFLGSNPQSDDKTKGSYCDCNGVDGSNCGDCFDISNFSDCGHLGHCDCSGCDCGGLDCN